MKIRIVCAAVLAAAGIHEVFAAEPADLFSRANCLNNESITYNYFDPPEMRGALSWHFKNGIRKHYVTENPAYAPTCAPGTDGNHQVNGLMCSHLFTMGTWHGGVHGAFNSSEPNPDGTLTPGVTTGWVTIGLHRTLTYGVGVATTYTLATDCNLHFEQFY
ncbi:Uncharacterised protein [Halioglobus japonicus]|nr:Uncharacterised protein [Halioglobus japonicus]